ncbi:MAG: SDR family NAD(P)-dependent oxidoreductase [Halioglobus sp.]
MARFTGRVAFVTGAASGIGRATAIRLAREEAQLFLADIDAQGLAQTVSELPEDATVHTVHLDVTDSQSCADKIEECVTTLGKLDVLCNIAGIAMCKHLTEIDDNEWQRMMNINISSVFYLCRAAMPHLIKSNGNIINMASSAGLEGQAYNSAYCATKAAVVMFSKSLAIEYSKQGVRVNSVCPGMVKTPLTEQYNIPEDVDEQLLMKMFPLVDGAEPEEIAASIAYLASDEARFVTGIAFPIDGAQTAG